MSVSVGGSHLNTGSRLSLDGECSIIKVDGGQCPPVFYGGVHAHN